MGPSSVAGNISTESINGFPIAVIQDIIKKTNTKQEVEDIYGVEQELLERIKRNWKTVKCEFST